MKEIRYADAGMDMKKWILWLIRKSWVALAAALIGAALGGAIYAAARTVPESEREYQAVSKLYLDFAVDETGEVYQEYNGYTWNDLMVTDPILDETMSCLSEDYTREEVMAATEATILSDLRLLTVTITTNDRERSDRILAATDQALENYGDSAKEFVQIQTIQATEAQLMVADSRLAQAVGIGAAIGLAAALLGLLLYYVLDDRILVASDVRQATEVPFVGYLFGEGREETAGGQFLSEQRLQHDYEASAACLRERCGEVLEIRINRKQDASMEELEQARKACALILAIPYGQIHGTYLAYLIGQYQARGCQVLGIAIENADIQFLNRYYGRAIGKEQ